MSEYFRRRTQLPRKIRICPSGKHAESCGSYRQDRGNYSRAQLQKVMMEERKNKWDSSDKWPEEINRIKSVLSQLPLTETIKWGVPVYTYNGKNVIGDRSEEH